MSSLRRAVPALAALLFAGLIVAGGAAPALAAPFPTGSQATALVGGTPLIQANCPTAAAVPPAGGNSTNGVVTVTGAGAQCTGTAAFANGIYAITGVASSNLRFSAACTNTSNDTGTAVDVPAGTIVNGTAVTTQTTITTLNTPVTFTNGSTAIANQVVITGTSVTRSALVFTGGPGTGVVVGQVVCGTGGPYPLAVDSPAGASAAPAVALSSSTGSGSSSHRTQLFLAAGGLAILVLAQVGIGRTMRRRRQGTAGS